MTRRARRRPAGAVDVVGIGAGHSGLSMSHALDQRALEHAVLASIDEWAERNALAGVVGPTERYAPTEVGASPRLSLVLGKDVRTVIWATGFRPDYSWLEAPVFDRKGELKHDRGVVDASGMYVLGLPYLRRRKSSFMHGAEDDVRELGAYLAAHLADPLDRATTQRKPPMRPISVLTAHLTAFQTQQIAKHPRTREG